MSADDPSTPSAERFTLAQYITALIETLGSHHPDALARMRLVVGDLRARIRLDDEACDVYFGEEGLVVQPANKTAAVDGEGSTDSGAVLSLLDGYQEVAEAILTGRLSVTGKADHVVKMFTAIEILLDASPRTPALQSLAARFRRERHGTLVSTESHGARRISGSEAGEQALLRRLGLLPNQ